MVWVTLFGVAFAFVEAGVVVYLQALYYPEGFTFPLKLMSEGHLGVEIVRETATIIMLAAVGVIAGVTRWQRFGYFLIAFGVWDVFYYVWLKVILGWPHSLTDWDVLFLIPLPWIGPVIAPVLIALLMIVCGGLIVVRIARGNHFRPVLLSWVLAFGATFLALYSFMSDTDATLAEQHPAPYRYGLLVASLVLYGAGFVTAWRRPSSDHAQK
jgi:hypothetical protein